MNRPPLGTNIVSVGRLARIRTSSGKGKVSYMAEWKNFPANLSGIYIGYRTLSDGMVYYHYDEGPEYETKNHFEAWLIVVDPRKNPTHVLPENCIYEVEIPQREDCWHDWTGEKVESDGKIGITCPNCGAVLWGDGIIERMKEEDNV